MGFAAQIVSDFLDPIDKFMTSGVTNLASGLEKPLIAGATLYIAIFGIMIVLGYIKAPVQDFVINVLKICIIITLVTQVENYNTYVKKIFFADIPDGLISALGAVPGVDTDSSKISSGVIFDRISEKTGEIGAEIREKGGLTDVFPIFVALIFGFLSMIVIMILLALVIYAKVALSLIIVVGPIFIALLLFRTTQSFFSSWLSVAVNFIVLQVLIMVMVTLLIDIISNQVTSALGQNLGDQIVVAFRLIGLFILSVYLATQLPGIAASIAGGGVALGGATLSRAADSATRIAGKGAGAAGRGAGAAGKWVANKMRGSGGSIENRS